MKTVLYRCLFLSSFVACSTNGVWKETGGVVTEKAPKVLFVGVDGLRGDGVPNVDTPNFDVVLGDSAWTFGASTQLAAKTVSGPGWTSMLTGVDADKHGIVDNGGWLSIERGYPTLIGRSHDVGLRTATAINWLPIQGFIVEPDTIDTAVVGKDAEIVDGMVDLIQNANSDVHFLALDNVDHVGHRTGFSLENPEYVDAIKMVDQQLGRLLSAIETRQNRLDEEWMVLITSDHGGEGTSHGALNEACRTIPLLIWGDTVVPGELDAGSHLDVHPTLMMHMGFHPEEAWALDGQVRGLADEA